MPSPPSESPRLIRLETEIERLRQENETLRKALLHVPVDEDYRVDWLRPVERTVYRLLRRHGFASYEQLEAALTVMSPERLDYAPRSMLRVTIHRLRRKGYEIQTISGGGYKLVRGGEPQ